MIDKLAQDFKGVNLGTSPILFISVLHSHSLPFPPSLL